MLCDEKIHLHKILTKHQLEELENLFLKYSSQTLSLNTFTNALLAYGIKLTNDEIKTLCMKIMGTSEASRISWNEFLLYLDLKLRTYNSINKDDLDVPIVKQPIIKNSQHKRNIINIAYHKPLENTNDEYTYITVSKDGGITYWDVNLKNLKYYSPKSDYLRMHKTRVLSVQSLCDIGVIAINLLERQIRFYESVNLYLLLTISLPNIVSCMHYHIPSKSNQISKLFLGDKIGNIRIIEIKKKFKISKSIISWSELEKSKISNLHVEEINSGHNESIQKIFYWGEFEEIFLAFDSCSVLKDDSIYPGIIILDKRRNQRIFNINKGVTCFWLDVKNQILATGGPDAYIRLWNPFVPKKPIMVFTGHKITICCVFIQMEDKIYSMDLEKIIKIWNIKQQTLLQTYTKLHEMYPRLELFSFFYNDNRHDLIIAIDLKLISVKCSEKINLNETDGYTSNAIISVVLYNERFQNIVTCDWNSNILIWDICTGTRQNYIKNSHKKQVHGKFVGIKITAACFNSKTKKYLLTSAEDGSIKIWNYNMVICVRQLTFENLKEITAVFWLDERILIMGHNKHVIEFTYDNYEIQTTTWHTMKIDEIIKAAIFYPQCLVTGSRSGQLIFRNLETGHGYRQHNINTVEIQQKNSIKNSDINLNKIEAMIFLESRPNNHTYGTLLVALTNGYIQVYSHHPKGSYMTKFYAVHKVNDYIVSMATDEQNEFLFTGTSLGYIKTWLITNYCIPTEEKVKISLISYRLQFIFLTKDRTPGRAKLIVKNQSFPILLNSYQGHLKAVTDLIYIQSAKILLSGSTDKTCRLWSLQGHYLASIGTPLPWIKIYTKNPIDLDVNKQYRIPPDIQKVASKTTLRVLSNIYIDPLKEMIEELKKKEAIRKMSTVTSNNETEIIPDGCKYGKSLTGSILGKHFKLPERTKFTSSINLDKTSLYIPVYTHLNVYSIKPILRPTTPDIIKNIKKIEFNFNRTSE